jgi:hypothetical protein
MSEKEHQLNILINALGAYLSPERREQTFKSLENIAKELEKLRSLDLHEVHPAVVFRPEEIITGDKNEF